MTLPPLDFLQIPGGMPGAAPQLPQPNIPQTPPMQQPPQRPSLWQRIAGGVAGGLGRLLAPPEYAPPPEIAGLMSPEQIGAAQRQARGAYADAKLSAGGANAANASQIGQNTFDAILGNAAKVSQFARENRLADEERAKTAKMEATREAVIAGVMQGANPDDPADIARRLNAALPQLLRMGDKAGVASLSGYLAANNALLNPRAPEMDVRVVDDVLGEDGKPYIVGYDNNTNAEVWRKPQFVPPRSSDSDGAYSNRRQARLDRLSARFNQETGPSISSQQQLRAALEAAPASGRDAMAQLQIVNAFARAMDDRTGVRDQERQQIVSLAPLYAKAQLYMQRETAGESVLIPPRELAQMVALLQMRDKAYTRWITDKRNQYVKQADADVDDTQSYFMAPPSDSSEATGPLGTGNKMTVPRTGKVWQFDK